jgi:drug/metabolite transporter (DMT)-like permease
MGLAAAIGCLVRGARIPYQREGMGSVLFLSIFCTGLAFIIQAVAQQYTSANHVGVIFT